MESLNSTFLVFIPKIEKVTNIKDFKAVGMMAVKCEGRQIMDVALLANEMVNDLLTKRVR